MRWQRGHGAEENRGLKVGSPSHLINQRFWQEKPLSSQWLSILRPLPFGELSITRSCCSPGDGMFLEHKPWAVLASGPGRYRDMG